MKTLQKTWGLPTKQWEKFEKRQQKMNEQVRQGKFSGDLYRVDLELTIRNVQRKLVKYSYAEYFPGRKGTADEEMAWAIAEWLKREGSGGRIVKLVGKKEVMVEEWPSLARVEAALEAEKVHL